ncbi:hypothetical protein GY45DRAFT_1322119 [Cubamyces sp. BRFM 1775]|nr:hypothetical protein GY45DRAFT_1322119 [Cubamyces sp. BRFM 1775]
MFGVLGIVLPAAFFAALDRGDSTTIGILPPTPLVSDAVRDWILKTSHAISILLFIVYVISCVRKHTCSLPKSVLDAIPQELRWFLPANPSLTYEGPAREKCRCRCICPPVVNDPPVPKELVPLMRAPVCMVLIPATMAVMSKTAEYLAESIDPVQERYHIQTEFFGLILLPLVTFLPEAVLALLNSMPQLGITMPPEPEARGTPTDSSIQFALLWMPIVIFVGWYTGKPIHLLFDYFEVAILLGTCFLVNYVTTDGETDCMKGLMMFAFYAMIATAAWFYPGQSEVGYMLSCPGSVASALASGAQNALASN